MKMRLPVAILQEKIFDRLKADMASTAIGTKVFDQAADDTAMPLVLIGDPSVLNESNKSQSITATTFPFEVYSDLMGMEQVELLAGSVSESLTKQELDLSASGFKHLDTKLETCAFAREWNGTRLRRRATLTFRLRVQDVS